jgi:UDP-2,4-diacetamido-2,4,6-trideoxy-beta-L-altropyranose hydrolase
LEVFRTRSVGIIGNPTWLVLDGYHFDPAYQQAVRDAGFHLLVIDDKAHLPVYHADILLNQNLGAEKLKYHCDSDTTLLIGSQYVLLRQEFMAWRGWQREIPKVARKVLVTMGGGDPDNVTLKVIHALGQVKVDELEAVIVVGGNNPNYDILKSTLYNLQFKIRLERNVSNMPELMAWADVSISAGGSTCWELAFMGVPSLLLVCADNQCRIAEELSKVGLVINLGWYEHVTTTQIAETFIKILDTTLRNEMSVKGKILIDGMGAKRVAKMILAHSIVLRRVSESDCEMLWKWVIDPEVRASSFIPDPIPFEKHRQWFSAKLRDSKFIQFIAMDIQGTPIGQVRFDINNDEAEIDISIAINQRGKGYGSKLIRKGVQEFQKMSMINIIHAFIKPENEPSLNSFRGAGFINLGLEMVKEHLAVHLIWRKNG